MNSTSKFFFATLIGLAPALASTSAHAVAPNFTEAAIVKINFDGFQICRAIGSTGYTAIARGYHSAGGGGDRSPGFRSFQIKTCFETQAQCDRFLDRIHHKVSNIEKFHYIRCNARG